MNDKNSVPNVHLSAKESILKWLHNQGFAIEYATYHAFRRHGFQAIMGIHLKNDNGEPREIDVCAIFDRSFSSDTVPYQIRLICECKTIPSGNCVIMKSSDGFSHEMLADALRISLYLQNFPKQVVLNELVMADRVYHFSRKASIGHTLLQAWKNPAQKEKDHAFAALQKVAGATDDTLRIVHSNSLKLGIFVMPVIVIHGKLFEVSMEANAPDFQVNEIKYGRVYWGGSGRKMIIDVVTIDGIDNWMAELVETRNFLDSFFFRQSSSP